MRAAELGEHLPLGLALDIGARRRGGHEETREAERCAQLNSTGRHDCRAVVMIRAGAVGKGGCAENGARRRPPCHAGTAARPNATGTVPRCRKVAGGADSGPSGAARKLALSPLAMKRILLFLAALLLGAAPALADVLIENVNGYTMREDGRLFRFNAIWIGDDGGCGNCSSPATAGRAPRYLLDGRGRTMLPGLIDAHGHVMGLGMGALLIDLSATPTASRRRRRGSGPMPPPIPPRAGSSGAAGTRSAGGSGASPPAPISTPPSPTGRSGSSGSTAMPAGRTAWRCARPTSPPPPRRRRAAGSSGPGATPAASSSTRR